MVLSTSNYRIHSKAFSCLLLHYFLCNENHILILTVFSSLLSSKPHSDDDNQPTFLIALVPHWLSLKDILQILQFQRGWFRLRLISEEHENLLYFIWTCFVNSQHKHLKFFDDRYLVSPSYFPLFSFLDLGCKFQKKLFISFCMVL